MIVTIDDAELDQQIALFASQTGQTPEQVVVGAVREKLSRVPRAAEPLSESERQAMRAKIRAIQKEVAALPILDHRSDDEILGYNEQGLFD